MFFILISVVFIGCRESGQEKLITQAEVDAVQNVLDFYGGICNRSKGFEIKNGNQLDYFKLSLSGSYLFESYLDKPEMPASNAAYLFYSSLGLDKSKYSEIRVEITFNNGQSVDFSYSTIELEELEKFIPILQGVSVEMKERDYQGLFNRFDLSSNNDLSVEQLEEFSTLYDSLFGTIKKTELHGFAFFDSNLDQRKMVHLAAVVVRKDENTPLSLFIDRKTKKLLSIKHEF